MEQKPKPILFTTDLSQASWGAFPKAMWLAEHLKQPLHVLSVVEPTASMFESDRAVEYQERLQAEMKLARELLGLEVQARGPGVELKVDVIETDGSVAKTILHHAEHLDAGMIVMATLGRTELRDFLVGSTAEKVVRLSEVPVLTVRVPPDDVLTG